MSQIFGEVLRQILVALIYVVLIAIAIKLGISFAKKKNEKKTASEN